MSIEAMALVLHHSKAAGAAKLILLGIANHQGDGGAYPAVSTLARYAQVSDRRAQQLLRELEASNELIIDIQAGGRGQYKTNLYWVNVQCPDDCDGTSNHRSGVKSTNIRGEIQRTSGVKPVSPKPLDKPLDKPIHAQNEFERAVDDAFAEFWNAYPRKVGKAIARKSFNRAVMDADVEIIVAGAVRFANDPNLPPKQFIPHPATWLNRAGWEDEPLPERVLTADEKKALEEAERLARVERDRIRREQDAIERERERAEVERQRRENPVEYCEHNRVIYICPKCNPIHSGNR